eukprot:TRINITY_DN55939_c0_g1_i1.p1 TRINITY_DN55939_c0_g1~~TRINITY_DN55939_c0_g1_i1.p1  ORF type:complete len:310 (+),score=56.23 TRINITY_DN55939_c0_g1_i1:46-930(+)
MSFRGGGRGGGRDGGRGRGPPGRGGGRDGGRGRGRGRGFGGPRTVVEPHTLHAGVFILRGKDDAICTLNMVPGVSVYGEKRVAVKVPPPADAPEGTQPDQKEYRTWSVYRSKLASAIVCGAADIHIRPGTRVLYLGGASGTTVSHVSDLIGPTGVVYAVEFSPRSGRDLVDMAQRRPNVVPIIEDARHPLKYRMLVGTVDTIFMDVAQPDQARIMGLNADYFLKTDGHFVISIKANCIDSVAAPEVVYKSEMEKLKQCGLKPKSQVSIDTFERGHCVVIGQYRPTAAKGEKEKK